MPFNRIPESFGGFFQNQDLIFHDIINGLIKVNFRWILTFQSSIHNGKNRELLRVKEEFSPDFEITDIADRVCKEAGPAFVFVDRVAYKHTLKEQTVDIPEQVCITKDNVQVSIDRVIFIQVTDPKMAPYGVNNHLFAITQLCQTTED